MKKATDSFEGKSVSLVHPEFPTVCGGWTPNWKLYFLYPYILFDPLSQFEFLFQGDPLRCPLCEPGNEENRQSCLRQTNLWKNGQTKRHNPRMLYDINSVVCLVYKTYSCYSGHTEIPATHPDILKRIPNCYLPFILKHKCSMTTECVEWISDKVRAGLSIRSIATIFEQKYEKEICARLERFWTDYSFARYGDKDKITLSVPSFDVLYRELKGCIPTKNVITDIVVANFK